ncbi:MAG: hypothetical protein Q8M94_09630 [Ignavibacteria bacterium]|nr:hypothetical protein [Ignavibacteria bacterium]
MIEDALIIGLTQIANYRLSKRCPDLKLYEWQGQEFLEALVLFQEEYERLPENAEVEKVTTHTATQQKPQKIAIGMCPDCGSTLWYQEGCSTCHSCGFSKCG